jgi:hypothetical protein
VNDSTNLPEFILTDEQITEEKNDVVSITSLILGIIIVGVIFYFRHSRKKSQIAQI